MAGWNADLIAKFDADRALKVQLDELCKMFRGTSNSHRIFQEQLVETILAAGYPSVTDLSELPNGRFMFMDSRRRAVFLPGPVQLRLMETIAVDMDIEADGDWRSTVMDRLTGLRK